MVNTLHRFPVIDAHVHIHPDNAEVLAEAMDTNNLCRVVNAGILEQIGLPFKESMRAFRRVLGERLIYFTTPDFRNTSPGFGQRMAHDLQGKVAGGARGLKIFKELGLRHKDADGHLIPVDDPRLDPLWAVAGELGVPVLIHTADPVNFFLPLDENNESWEELQQHPDWHFWGPEFPKRAALLGQFERLVRRHPGTVFVAAHVAHNAEDLDYADACLGRHPNLYVDTASRIAALGRHPPERVRTFFVKHQDRVLFGTDLLVGWDAFDPVDPDPVAITRFYDIHWRFFETLDRQFDHPFPIEGRWKVDGLGLPESVLEKFYFRNAQRLIPGP